MSNVGWFFRHDRESRAIEPRQKNHRWHRRSSLWLTIACELCDKVTAAVAIVHYKGMMVRQKEVVFTPLFWHTTLKTSALFG